MPSPLSKAILEIRLTEITGAISMTQTELNTANAKVVTLTAKLATQNALKTDLIAAIADLA